MMGRKTATPMEKCANYAKYQHGVLTRNTSMNVRAHLNEQKREITTWCENGHYMLWAANLDAQKYWQLAKRLKWVRVKGTPAEHFKHANTSLAP